MILVHVVQGKNTSNVMVNSIESIQVAVGVIERDEQVLIAQRLDGRHCAGLWEFPGGKLEAGECAKTALRRELHEELGIDVQACDFLLSHHHTYPTRHVELLFYRVTAFSGEPQGREGQPVRWVTKDTLQHYEFPPANLIIINQHINQTTPS